MNFESNFFNKDIEIEENFIFFSSESQHKNQQQTNKTFSEKWEKVDKSGELKQLEEDQRKWFMSLYGFKSEGDFQKFLQNKKLIIDAGCGLGYKTAWMAELAPDSTVIGIDYSDASKFAAKKYKHLKNAYFMQGDIAETHIKEKSLDFILCDQVIMHTEQPEVTFTHLSGLLKKGGVFACYVYAKKALPRELLDDYFRSNTHNFSSKELWEMSDQLTELGRILSELNIQIDVPDIPLLDIKGGKIDLQRFIYWNFIKCFYRPDWDKGLCDSTNFDWYSPSNAKRYSKEEFEKMIEDNRLSVDYFHSEEACYSGRFTK